MPISDHDNRDQVSYRERLAPPLWILIAAALLAPMVGLVFIQVNQVIAYGLGCAIALVAIVLLIASAPVIEVRGDVLRAGRAHIPVSLLGPAVASVGEAARLERGMQLDARSWLLIRGGIDGIVTVPVTDPDDPTPSWVLSSRTPDRLASAIEHAQLRQRTPGRSDLQDPRGRAASGA